MARSKPWYKTWSTWLSRPDLARLDLGQVGAWWKLYALAHQCGAGGRLVNDAGRGFTLDEMCQSLHLVGAVDIKCFKKMVDKQLSTGSLRWDGNILIVAHYVDEQEAAAPVAPGPRGGAGIKGSKEALRQRVARWRREHPKQKTPAHPLHAPLPLEPLPQEENTDKLLGSKSTINKRKRKSVTPLHAGEKEPVQIQTGNGLSVTAGEKVSGNARENVGILRASEANVTDDVTDSNGSVTDVKLPGDPVLKEMTRLYTENIGELPHGGLVIEDMIDFTKNYKGDVRWIKMAFKEALTRNKRNLRYILSILENWQEQGGPDGRPGQEWQRILKAEQGDRSGADRRDSQAAKPGEPPPADWRKEWKVKRSGPGAAAGGEDQQ